MKKLLILLTLCTSSLLFANTSNNEALEDRLENKLEYNFKTLQADNQSLKVDDYDVDVYDNYVNVKIEVKSNPQGFNFDKALLPIKNEIVDTLKTNPKINIVVEHDKRVGEDEIIFNKDF